MPKSRIPDGLAGRALRCALLAAAVMTVTGNAIIEYQGDSYDISVATSPPQDLAEELSLNFWWRDGAAASAACMSVGAQLGAPNDFGRGPYFFFDFSDNDCYYYEKGTCTGISLDNSNVNVTLAFSALIPPSPSPSAALEASPSAAPEASLSPSPEASLSPSPGLSPSPAPAPLDCSQATLSPPSLSSRLTGQICAANKAIRQGKQSKFITAVTLSLVDASNQLATINITDIVTNKVTAGWQCRCRPTGRDNCTCLPNAILTGGGNFLVLPQWRRSTRPGKVVDTTLQVSFTATAGDGGTCSGNAVICSTWGQRRNSPPPTCSPFNSTGVTRPALTCV